MDWKQRALYNLMSDISEEHYSAGWMMGNEFSLWAMLCGDNAERLYGFFPVDQEKIDELRAISQEIGGWIYWHDDAYEPDLPSEEWGPRFISMEAWLERYSRAQQPA